MTLHRAVALSAFLLLARFADVAAAPTFVAAGTFTAGTGATSVPWPAGHQANDIGLLIIETANQAVATPAGWTVVTNSPQGTGTAGGTAATQLAVFWRRAASAAEANAAVADPGNHTAAQIYVFRGVVNSGNPWDVTAGNVAAAATTAVSIPGATTTVADTLVVAIVANGTDTTVGQTSGETNASLTGLASIGDNNTNSGNGGGFDVITGVMATAGAYANTTALLATASVQGRMSIALRPETTYFSRASTGWGTASTWSTIACGGGAVQTTPPANSTVTICTGNTVTVDTNTANIGSLTVQTAGVLTVGGFALSVGGATGITGTVNFNNAAGSASLSGDLTLNSGAVWNETAAAPISLAGSLSNAATTWTASTGTHTFSGTTKTISGATTTSIANVSVTGTYTNNATLAATTTLAGAGTLTQGSGATLQIGGTNTVGTLDATTNANTVDYNGTGAQTVRAINYSSLTISGARTTNSVTLPNGGTIGVAATFNPSATFTTGNYIITGNTVNFNGSGAQTIPAFNYNSLTSSSTGARTLASSGTIGIAGTFTPGTNAYTITGSTVNFNGAGAQTVPAFNYNHLTLSGARTTNNVTLVNGGTIGIAGDFSATATFSTGNYVTTGNTVTLNGTGAQSVAAFTFNNLTLNKSSGTATLGGNVTVSSVLTFTSGVVDAGSNTLITSANCPGSVTRPGSGHVVGNLQLRFATGAQTCTFHVGDSTNYTPLAITFTNVSAAGSLIGTVANSGYTDSAYPLDSAHDVNRYWTLRLPAAGALAFTGSFSTTLTYVAGDNDAGNTASAYAFARGDSCAPPCTWTLPAVSGTPSNTSASATGMTPPLSTAGTILAVGRRRAANYLITVPASVSTCNAAAITITARDSSNNTATNYTGTVNITTSTSDGDWSLTTGSGTLTNSGTGASGVADDGKATYAFATADLGVVVLSLSNILVNSDVTITVVDNGDSGTSTTSSTIQFRGNQFAIANDAIQVAGKAQAMTVTRQRGASCTTTLTEYAGSKNLKAWYTADVDHPAGAIAPAITGASPAITTSVPGANNLTLSFAAGVASLTLTTSDVGKYTVSMRDDAAGNVDGTSPTITTRPFALLVTGIKQGTTDNPSGTAAAGSKFAAAASSFQATIGGYLYNAAADGNNDGNPDGTATLAQIAGGGLAPHFAWGTTLAAAAPFTPAGGALGTLSNGSLASGSFSGGSTTPATLSYNDVGSFTLDVQSTSFLNTAGADYTTANGKAIVFDVGGARNAVVGRIFPDHFTLLAGSSVTPGCASGGFTYEGQAALGYSFTVEARSALPSNTKTSNYRVAGYTVGTTTVALQAENSNNGTPLSSRLTGPAGSWTSGSYAATTTDTFSRAASPDGPFDSLQIGVQVTDSDGPVLDGLNMNQATSGACAPCTAQSIAAATKVRFGILRLQNAAGNLNVDLPLPIETRYWNGSVFTTNTLDNCTSLAAANLSLGSYTGGINGTNMGSAAHISIGGAFASGVGNLKITKASPAATAPGATTLTVDLAAEGKTYLQGAWGGSTYTFNPTARASWGLFGSQPQNFIFQRENY